MLTCCTRADLVGLILVGAIFVLLLHAPILKPWFGLRKPKGHRGRWFE